MESQIAHSDDHDQEQNRQSVGTMHLGEEEVHPEKKSMLTKVKDKAKKMTKTMKKHGQGQEQDQDDEDEDPELHSPKTTGSGAPGQGDIHKVPLRKFGDTSAAKRDGDPSVPIERTDLKVGEPINTRQADPVQPGPRGHEEISGQRRGDVGRTNVTGEGVRSPLNTPVSSFKEHKSKVSDEGNLGRTGLDENNPVHKANVTGNEGLSGQSRQADSPVSLGEYKSKISDPSHAPVTGKEGRSGQLGVTLDRPRGLEEDPHSPKAKRQASDYETKVPDPAHAGGEEIGIPPIVQSLEKMNINAGSEHNQDRNPVSNSPTGSHDQFSAENPPNQSTSYTGQISSAASAISGKAISAKNVVTSKLGYGGNTDLYGDEVNARSGSTTEPEQPQKKGIAATVTEKLTPVYSTVAGAGSTVISKVGGRGGTAGSKDVKESTTGQEKGGSSVKGYLSEKLKPGEEDKALSEVITETLHKKKTAEPPVAKVTGSAEVTRQLGPDQGEEKVEQSSYGKVVADTLKGAVGSLFGKTDQSSPASSPQSRGSTTGTEGFPSSGGGGVAEQRSRGGVEQQKIEGN